MRGNSHLIIFRYGSPLDGIRSIAFLAKGLACSSVCRLSFGIHSRMILRRASRVPASCSIFCSKRRSTAAQGRVRCFRSRQGDEDKAASVGDLVSPISESTRREKWARPGSRRIVLLPRLHLAFRRRSFV